MDIQPFLNEAQSWLAAIGGLSLQLGKTSVALNDVLLGVVVIVLVFWGASRFVRHVEHNLRSSGSLSYSARELLIKFLKVTIYFTGLVVGLHVVGIDITAFAVFGGALGVGLGLGLQRITANFVSGITLLLEKSVKLGDYIQIGNDIQGFVRALNIRYTLIETARGTEILIPNETLTTSNVINWTLSDNKGRIEILFTMPYSADPKQILLLALAAARGHNKCLKDPEPQCFLKQFRDVGIEYMLVFWVADIADGLLGPQSDVMASLLAACASSGLNFAEPFVNPLDKR